MSLKLKKPEVVEVKKSLKQQGYSQEQVDHMLKYQKYYENAVLSYEQHKGLVQNIEYISERSGVPIHFIVTSGKGIFTDDEMNYIREWKHHRESQKSGAVYIGTETRALDSMFAFCGLMLRNEVDSKIVFMHELIASLKRDEPFQQRFIAIPNFILPKKMGGDIATWEFATILGWLMARHGAGKHTLLYVSSYNLIEEQYGKTLSKHIDDHYYKFQD